MGRAPRGKKTEQNAQIAVENTDENQTTPDKLKNLKSKAAKLESPEEIVPNGDSEAKANGKATKAVRGKKESKPEIQNTEPKTKVVKKGKTSQVKNGEALEQEVPAEKEVKKRTTKKKLDDKPEDEMETKRNKKEPVNESNEKGEKSEQNGNASEPIKKRARKETVKSSEEPSTTGTNEPEKKRSKKAENVKEPKKTEKAEKSTEEPVDEKKVKGKTSRKADKAAEKDEAKVTAPKKGKGKAATKKDEVTEEEKEPEEVEKPTAKQTKAKVTKKTEENENVKKSRGKAASSNEPEEKTEPLDKAKKAKTTKKAETVQKSPKAVKEKAPKKTTKSVEGKQLQNSIKSDFNIDFGISSEFNCKIAMWNTSGLRSCVDKGCVDYFIHENPDIICINEIKCGTEEEIPEKIKLEGYHAYWNVGKGFPGVGILTKQMPMEVFYDLPGEFSQEKRLITAEFKKFYLVCCYVVNSGRGLKTLDKRLEWNKVFDDYIKDLDKKKPVIIAGDMNVAHTEIDLTNPKTNQKNAGFTKEEREGFSQLLSYGFVDTFRSFYPDQTGAYTFWSYMNNARAKNVGWRLDYFITSERFMDKVKDSVIRSTIKGSDHCPIVLFLQL